MPTGDPLESGFGSVEDVNEWEDARKFLWETWPTTSGRRNPPPFYNQQTEAGSDLHPKLLCPLCRGDVYGWSVVDSALRPTEVDPERQRDWTRLERERDYEDMLSSIQAFAGEESNGESFSDLEDFRSWLTINLAYLTLALEFISDSRSTDEDSFWRRSGSRWFRYDRESDHGPRENSSSISDRALLGFLNNAMPEERLPGRHRGTQGILQWRNRGSASDRVSQGRRQSSQADRTCRGQGGLRWRTPRWYSNNGQ
ncbi:Glutaredoxin 4 isoform 1 [Hibiscus syriacus]|uniref:Glutaredoxin 4 isoform 1 n=1 Tax=Hibiscus syriacus TaxID=106335 RepID=A0A6A3B3Z6_HIBSY|nr:Glutaredoxin 4 isoform 1 [Hibiscus syriacus]